MAHIASARRSLRVVLRHGLAVACFAAAARAADNCSFQAVALPITNATNSGVTARGAVISVGLSLQQLATQVSYTNDTWIFDVNSPCTDLNWTTSKCNTFEGIPYNFHISPTYTNTTNAVTEGNLMGYIAKDNLHASNVSLDAYSYAVFTKNPGDAYHSQHYLGLGVGSTLLSTLRSSSAIASKTWSYFYGLTGATTEHQMDGSVVLGGYDAAKITGDNITFSLGSNSCGYGGMAVTIMDFQLLFPNGTRASIFSSGAALGACVQPDFPGVIAMPHSPYFSDFESLTSMTPDPSGDRSFGYDFFTMLYTSSSVFRGDIAITLWNGTNTLNITVPNHQLVRPEVSINSNGDLVANSSKTNLLMLDDRQVNQYDLAIIGRQFFTSAYLMVNYDDNDFTLWSANPTTAQDLRTVYSKDGSSCISASTSPTPIGTSIGTPSTSTTPIGTSIGTPSTSPTPTPTHGLSGGAIAAIVIGVIGGLALVGLAVWFLHFCRRRPQLAEQPAEMGCTDYVVKHEQMAPSLTQGIPAADVMPHELQAKTQRPQELPT